MSELLFTLIVNSAVGSQVFVKEVGQMMGHAVYATPMSVLIAFKYDGIISMLTDTDFNLFTCYSIANILTSVLM